MPTPTPQDQQTIAGQDVFLATSILDFFVLTAAIAFVANLR
jgi:hypothetical protein